MKIINKDQVSYIKIFNEVEGVLSSWGHYAKMLYQPYIKSKWLGFYNEVKEGFYQENYNELTSMFMTKEFVEKSNKFFIRDNSVWTFPCIEIFCGKDLIHKEYFTKFATLEQHVNYNYPNCKIKYE